MCSSLVAGFAGAHLWSRASTPNSRSTAGFLFCTWAVGLVQTGQQSVLGPATELSENMDAESWLLVVIVLLAGPLRAIQVVWILYLPLQRLESLQQTAGREIIPVYAPLNLLVLVSLVLGSTFWMMLALVVATITQVLIIWFYCKIMSACRHVYAHLAEARQLVEISGGTEKCQTAFKMAQKAILAESWGLRVMFLSTVVMAPLLPILLFLFGNRSPELVIVVQCSLLLFAAAGAWILSNAHGVSDIQGWVITILLAVVVGLVLPGAKISGWRLFLVVLSIAVVSGILALLTDDYFFKQGELQTKCVGLFCVESTCKDSLELEWRRKVTDLSRRGITARALLDFYKKLGRDLMPHYVSSVHTTNDVVRQAIIPATKQQRCAYALLAEDGPVKPDRMVTHSWQNKFRDLVAAVIADAVNESSFDLVSRVLDSDMSVLETMLDNQGTGNTAYWICAFSVNQHAGICGGNPNNDRDSITKKVHPICDCGLPKMFNATPPLSGDGRSIGCEMNKFDDMMALLAAGNSKFAQVVAVDQAFGLFTRAWCVAELVQADETNLKQSIQMHSRPLLVRKKGSLRNLKVENMEASRPEDVEYILSRIPNKNVFNQKLQHLIFDKAGLLSTWFQLDAARQMEEVGNLLKWSLADDGRGDVWQFWSKWGKGADNGRDVWQFWRRSGDAAAPEAVV
eukprot:Skav219921  [mRNA]  locus=scaffold2006:164192:166462:- [translate_table: standard]